MGKGKPRRGELFRLAVVLAGSGFLAACAVDPIEPTVASAGDPIEPSTAGPVGPTAVSATGSVEPAPVSATTHIMSTDVAGPVDLGPEPAPPKAGRRLNE